MSAYKTKAEEIYRRAVADAWRPDPIISVGEWAEANRVLTSDGASAEPGPYRLARTPYVREILDSLSINDMTREVVFMAGSQVGKSEVGNNWIGYIMSTAPGPALLVQPTVETARRYSKMRIATMIRATPCLAAKIEVAKGPDASSAILEKSFPGGILIIAGANSAAGLRSMPIRYLMADEITNWPADVDGEGDPLKLAEARTATFARRKIYKCSTPSRRGTCRITAEYEDTDQRKYFVPCPDCHQKQVLVFSNLTIPRRDDGSYMPEMAHFVCTECGSVIEERHKTWMLEHGEWRATNPLSTRKRRRGYHISGLYSPIGWLSWAEIAEEFLKVKHDPARLKTFVNNRLAEPWEEQGETLNEHEIQKRAEDYVEGTIPDGVMMLTCGVDVHPNRLELEVLGFGAEEENWSIDVKCFFGDPQASTIWDQLDAFLAKVYQHPRGYEMQVLATCIDSGGANTRAVYDYCVSRYHLNRFAVKGVPGEGKPPVGSPSRNNISKLELFPVGQHTIKDIIFGRLRITEPGPGYCHFPRSRRKEYYQQLTAERLVTLPDGVHKRYEKIPGRRNEALDCRVYAIAAYLMLGIRPEDYEASRHSQE